MRVASSICIEPADSYSKSPARLVLKDDEHGEMASVPLSELAAALAPFLTLRIDSKDDRESHER